MSRTWDSFSLQTLVRERIDGWEAGKKPDAACVLEQHPELRGAKSLVMHLILAEYELGKEAGEAPAVDALCDRFPDYRQSIVKLLEVHATLDRRPPTAEGRDRVRWPVAGDEFLGYTLVEPLGVGGLARVFLAREKAVGNRFVVVKISPFGNREAHTLGKLSHPSIVPIHSVGHDEDENWTVICMPFLGVATGVDLLDRAFPQTGGKRNGQLIERVAWETIPLEDAACPDLPEPKTVTSTYSEAVAHLGLQLAEALVAAHAAGIVHRDIKPSNVLLAWSGRAMLLDFNLSTETGTKAAGLGGTLPYMAPELVADLQRGDVAAARRFCPAGDIYSLGVVLYELLTGQLPAKPENAERLSPNAYQPWLDAKRQPLAPLSKADSSIDTRLPAIVNKCLAFEVAERYSSAAELVAALQSYLSRGAQLGRLLKRRRREVLLAAVGLLLGGTGIATYIGTRPTELEVAYQRGLSLYDEGKYGEAEEMFTRCLELQSGWPPALFARAQSLRKLGKWREAREDFKGIENVDKGWANAFAGFCNMRIPDNDAAFHDYRKAQDAGLRDIDFLLNFARTQKKRGWHSDAAKLFSEVLAIDPNNKGAIRDRAVANLMVVKNSREKIPSAEAFEDALRYRTLETSYEGSHLAASVFGEAARKDARYHDDAILFLTESISKGLPSESLATLTIELKRLLPFIDASVLQNARSVPQFEDRRQERTPIHELADSPRLDAFLLKNATKPPLLAQRQ
jgi:serine/threonine protein kinase